MLPADPLVHPLEAPNGVDELVDVGPVAWPPPRKLPPPWRAYFDALAEAEERDPEGDQPEPPPGDVPVSDPPRWAAYFRLGRTGELWRWCGVRLEPHGLFALAGPAGLLPTLTGRELRGPIHAGAKAAARYVEALSSGRSLDIVPRSSGRGRPPVDEARLQGIANAYETAVQRGDDPLDAATRWVRGSFPSRSEQALRRKVFRWLSEAERRAILDRSRRSPSELTLPEGRTPPVNTPATAPQVIGTLSDLDLSNPVDRRIAAERERIQLRRVANSD